MVIRLLKTHITFQILLLSILVQFLSRALALRGWVIVCLIAVVFILFLPLRFNAFKSSIIYRALTTKEPGSDGITPFFASNCAVSLAFPLYLLHTRSVHERYFPKRWRVTPVFTIFKSGDKFNVCHYRPISKISFGKVFEE